jgi:WD40 repeat protein
VARIFLSHSSANDAEAVALHDWLVAQGWNDLFLDLHPERGLKAGERWQAALKSAAERCEVVVFLVSPAWAASKWCLAEFLLAKQMNKRILGVIVEPTPFAELPAELTAEWQIVDLTAGPRHYETNVTPQPGTEPIRVTFADDGLRRLKIGLVEAGLDPKYFNWPPPDDPDRAPYRGLRPLEAKDAGIFFGRDGPIVLGLDLIRGLRDAGPPRLLVILGASGAGKSSFMRAGLLPRLAREDKHFLPLPIVRPERAVLSGETGLIRSLQQALKDAGHARSLADIRRDVQAGPTGLIPLLRELGESKIAWAGSRTDAPKPPSLILPIDQAEELFASDGAAEAESFLKLIRDVALLESPALIVLFTIRSDNYERLQTARALEGLRHTFLSLPPMPQGSFADVIKGPARRLAGSDRPLKIQDQLTDTLLGDIEQGGAKDALPLLAFTLERLYTEHGGDGDLTLAEYEQLGRVRGSIEAAVECALKKADSNPAIPTDRATRLALLRQGLVPWLAGIDPDTDSPRRRVARLTEIPPEARPLIELLVEQRLVTTDVAKDDGEITIEPAHEALLRQWGLLCDWLNEDREDLAALEGVKRASRDWHAYDCNDEWLTHSSGRLDAAESAAARTDFAGLLKPTEQAYLMAARAAENARQLAELARLKRDRRRSHTIAYGSLAAACAIAALGWLMYQEWQKAEQNWALSNHNFGLALLTQAETEMANDKPTHAFVTASTAVGARTPENGPQSDRAPLLNRATDAFLRAQTIVGISAASAAFPDTVIDGKTAIYAVSVSPQGDRVAFASQSQKVSIVRTKDQAVSAELQGHKHRINSIEFSHNGVLVATASMDRTVGLWDTQSNEVTALCGHKAQVNEVDFNPSGTLLASAGGDRLVQIWDTKARASKLSFTDAKAPVQAVRFSADGRLLGYADEEGNAVVRSTEDWSVVTAIKTPEKDIVSIDFSSDGTKLITASYAGVVRVWSVPEGTSLGVLAGNKDKLWRIRFTPDQRIAAASWDGSVHFWDSETLQQEAIFDAHDHWVTDVAFATDTNMMATASEDGKVRLWRNYDSAASMFAVNFDQEEDIQRAAFSKEGSIFATGGFSNKVIVYRMDGRRRLHRLCEPIEHPGPILGLALSSDGQMVASLGNAAGATDNAIILTDTTRCEAIRRIEVGGLFLTNLALDPSNRFLAATAHDGAIRIFDIESETDPRIFDEGHAGPVASVTFDPSGQYLASAGLDGKVIVWRLADGSIFNQHQNHAGPIWFARFSPDGRLLVSAGGEKSVHIWDWKSGRRETQQISTATTAAGLLFSYDGKRLVVGDDDRSLTIWDTATWERIAVLSALVGVRGPLAPHPQLPLIAFDGENGAVRFWDLGRVGSDRAAPDHIFTLEGTRVRFANSNIGRASLSPAPTTATISACE